jgi:hypothetical protein
VYNFFAAAPPQQQDEFEMHPVFMNRVKAILYLLKLGNEIFYNYL